MSLYDKSSLIQVPSLYKDGTLVSTIPEDRSGDFTVARGSNLAATRIGEDGYIKKGYENLLLQSNSFSDAAWDSASTANVTPNQQGYDGSNNAWKLISTDRVSTRIAQTISANNLNTISIYAKAAEWNYVGLYAAGLNKGVMWSLIDGSVAERIVTMPDIYSDGESIGDGWWRFSLTYNSSSTDVRIYTSSVPLYNGGVGDGTSGILIQDAMLNQGLVAYPYLETITAPVQGGLLENSPRLDWSNGVPAVKLEEQRTNLYGYSEYSGIWSQTAWITTDNYAVSPEGVKNAFRAVSSSTGGILRIGGTGITGQDNTLSVWAKSNTGSDQKFRFFANGNTITSSDFTATTEWQRFDYTYACTFFTAGIKGASSELSDILFYGFQHEEGSYPSSYIPTYGTSQTRSNEVISDNFDIPTTATIYNSFYSDTAETVFVLDQVFNVVEGLNKVAIAFSPTAVKISVGGSIVANATGSYDTTALSNIQLGSNNGTDYSNAPISGFYVFPEFLTDEELNSLTD